MKDLNNWGYLGRGGGGEGGGLIIKLAFSVSWNNFLD